MSRRARAARRLASILGNHFNLAVRVWFDRDTRRYRCTWTGGPDVDAMYKQAVIHAEQVPELDVAQIVYDRQAPPTHS